MADRIDDIVEFLNRAKETGTNVMDYLPNKFPATFGINPMTSGDKKMAEIMKTTPEQLQSTRKAMGISDTDPSVLLGGSMNIVNKARSAAGKVGDFFKKSDAIVEPKLTSKGYGVEQTGRSAAEVDARMAARPARPAPPEVSPVPKGGSWEEEIVNASINKNNADVLKRIGVGTEKVNVAEDIANVARAGNKTGIFPYLAGGAAAGLGAGLIDRAINPNAGIFEDVAVKPETAPTGSAVPTGQQAGQTGSTTKNQGIGETPTAPAQTTPEQQAEEEKIPYNYNETTTDRNRMADDLRMAGLSAEDAELVRQGKEDQITNAESYGLAKRALAAKEYETQVPKTGYMTRDEAIAEGITAPEAPVGPVSKYGTPETMYGNVQPASGDKAMFTGVGGSRLTKYDPIIEKHAGGDKFLANLSKAMIQVESGGNPDAVSNKGAFGVSQFMPATAKKYGVIRGNSPEAVDSQVRGNIAYINDLRKKYGDNIPAIISAYHAGETNYDAKKNLGRENRSHVQKVMSALKNIIGVPSVEAAELPQPQRGADVQRDVNEMVKYNRPLEGPLGGPTGIVRQPEALPETAAPVAPAKKYGIFDAMDRAAANVDVLKGGIWTQKGGRKMTTAEQTEQQIEKAVQRGDIAEAKVLSDTLQNMAQGKNYESEAALREALLPFAEGKSKAEIAKMETETKAMLQALKDTDLKDTRSLYKVLMATAPKVDVYENGEKTGQRTDIITAIKVLKALGLGTPALDELLAGSNNGPERKQLSSGKWAVKGADGKWMLEQ